MKICITSEAPSDARITASSDDGELMASASLWWKQTSIYEGRQIATIGDFSAISSEAARALLDAATAHLRGHDCTIVVGPMDKNTWQKHRFVVESNGRAPFLLEPQNPSEHPDWWRAAGFSEFSHYSSSLIPLDGEATVSSSLKLRILSCGVTIHSLDPCHFEDELRSIHSLSLKSFASNFLYTPQSARAFFNAYSKIRVHIDPDLVKIARKDGHIVGFVFGIPDLAAPEKPALIVKTLAVDPTARTAGLGSLLVDELHLTGFSKGYTEAIHALQHESNTSLKITSRHQGVVIRRYALFSKSL